MANGTIVDINDLLQPVERSLVRVSLCASRRERHLAVNDELVFRPFRS